MIEQLIQRVTNGRVHIERVPPNSDIQQTQERLRTDEQWINPKFWGLVGELSPETGVVPEKVEELEEIFTIDTVNDSLKESEQRFQIVTDMPDHPRIPRILPIPVFRKIHRT